MKVKFILITILVLFLINGCGKKELEGYTQYQNSDHGFTISYPEDWTYREGFGKNSPSGTGAIVVFQSPSAGKTDVFRENTYIFTESLPDSVTDVESYLEYNKNELPAQLEEFTILDEGTLVIDDEKSKWIIFDYVNRLQRVQSMAHIFYRDGQGFVITSTGRPESFMSFRRTFENIAESIEFN